jgi:hypothetical protein
MAAFSLLACPEVLSIEIDQKQSSENKAPRHHSERISAASLCPSFQARAASIASTVTRALSICAVFWGWRPSPSASNPVGSAAAAAPSTNTQDGDEFEIAPSERPGICCILVKLAAKGSAETAGASWQ